MAASFRQRTDRGVFPTNERIAVSFRPTHGSPPRLAPPGAHVASLFQYSRPVVSGGALRDRRSPARMLVAVLDGSAGLVLVDATRSAAPTILYPREGASSGSPSWRALVSRKR